MADFGFVGPSYEAPSIYQDAQECINFFGEVDKQKPQGSRGYVALYPTPGLTKILQLDNAPVRGMRALSGGKWLLVVVGEKVYSIDLTSGEATYTQTIPITGTSGIAQLSSCKNVTFVSNV